MKSPFTGGNAILKTEKAELEFRREKFQYISLYYLCEDTNERFTTTEIDTLNLSQVYNQYRVKYGIPFPDVCIPADTRSPIPVIPVHSVGNLQYMWQS